MPLVDAQGALVAMKGSSIATEIDEARDVLSEFGCAEPTVSTLGEGLLDETTLAVRVAWADPTTVGSTSLPVAARRRQGASQSGSKKARTKRRKNT